MFNNDTHNRIYRHLNNYNVLCYVMLRYVMYVTIWMQVTTITMYYVMLRYVMLCMLPSGCKSPTICAINPCLSKLSWITDRFYTRTGELTTLGSYIHQANPRC